MWKINKQFIDDAIASHNKIFLSHDPYNSGIRTGFYKMELDYIEKECHGKIRKISNKLWEVVF